MLEVIIKRELAYMISGAKEAGIKASLSQLEQYLSKAA